MSAWNYFNNLILRKNFLILKCSFDMSRTQIIHSIKIYVLIIVGGVVLKLFIILSSIKITQTKNSLLFVGLISHHKNIINSCEEEEHHIIYSPWIINEVRLVEEKHHKKIYSQLLMRKLRALKNGNKTS